MLQLHSVSIPLLETLSLRHMPDNQPQCRLCSNLQDTLLKKSRCFCYYLFIVVVLTPKRLLPLRVTKNLLGSQGGSLTHIQAVIDVTFDVHTTAHATFPNLTSSHLPISLTYRLYVAVSAPSTNSKLAYLSTTSFYL